jgi:hypothetical protein
LGQPWGSPRKASAANSATEQAMLGGGVRYNTVARRLPRVNVCRATLCYRVPVRALMKCRSQRFKFDLPDEWWAAAGMVGFVTYRTAYRCCAVRRTMILRIDDKVAQGRT